MIYELSKVIVLEIYQILNFEFDIFIKHYYHTRHGILSIKINIPILNGKLLYNNCL